MRQPERLGKYRILKSLGAGAMDEVYLAEHEMLRVLHAVKILAPQAGGKAGFEARFQAEARTMARLRHPGIVPVHYMDRDEATGAYFIVMDFVSPDGKNQQTLDDLLKRSGGRLPFTRTAEILGALCDTVAYAHGEGVLHRDIKPSNVLIDAGGIVRLTGFYPAETVGHECLDESIGSNRLEGSLGLKKNAPVEKGDADELGSDARFLSGRIETLAGPFHCIPPEVRDGGEWSERGDIYTLGVVAYRMLTGKTPIGKWRLPSELFPDIPKGWDRITGKALETAPEERYESVREMSAEIALLGGAPDGGVRPDETQTDPKASSPSAAKALIAPENGRRFYPKPFFFKEKEYRTMESLVEAFAESEEKWSDALVTVNRGYVRKWLESNDDYGRAAEFEKHSERSPEEQLGALLVGYGTGQTPEALFRLGECFRNGWGTEKDEERAGNMFLKAAEQGHPRAQYVVGDLCSEGRGLRRDNALAADYYRRAARQGQKEAQEKVRLLTLEKKLKAPDGSVLLLVPAGEFEMGDGTDDDRFKHRVWLDSYYIGKFCVTNSQYARFVAKTGYRTPEGWKGFFSKSFPGGQGNHPVTGVSWDDAMAYAGWAGCGLPTEAQWEKAARGPEGFIYPWGDEWDASKCRNNGNRGSGTTAPVDAYPEGASGYGTYQQSGNVWEWCRDWHDREYYNTPESLCNPEGPSTGSNRVGRGGGWGNSNPSEFRSTDRAGLHPSRRLVSLGFRLARRA